MEFPHDLAEAALHEDDPFHLGALADDLVLPDVGVLRQRGRHGLEVHVSHVGQKTWRVDIQSNGVNEKQGW